MKQIICDKCKKECGQGYCEVRIQSKTEITHGTIDTFTHHNKNRDLCFDCVGKLKFDEEEK